MDFDALHYPFASRRNCVYATHGMVATSQPLAAQAGLQILQRGGNAIDAAVATAAVLTVVEPTSNGIGSDAFAIVWHKGKMHGLNGSGRSPAALTMDALKRRGLTELPAFGWLPVTVPGTPAAWADLVAKFGKLPLKSVLEPAIEYARHGFPVSPVAAKYWAFAAKRFGATLHGPEFENWFNVFTRDGAAPAAGEMFRSPAHADTLEAIANSNARDFYEGDLAGRIDSFSRETGGLIGKGDLMQHASEWVEPLSVDYRGYDVWELPPNGQGLVTLLALNILRGYDLGSMGEIERAHLQIEATKLAFEDARRHIADPDFMRIDVAELLSDEHTRAQRNRIGQCALQPLPGKHVRGGTVYLATADGEGNMVSYIQSNYMGFGSGIVVPGTGIALQNRGHNFSMDPDHPNALGPNKRTYHTIIPGFLTQGGRAVGPFGVMGGFMQPQGHTQVVVNTLDLALNPQAALDAPRWRWERDRDIVVESSMDAQVVQALADRGHNIEVTHDSGGFGRGQIIWRDEAGVLVGGTEPRTDGTVAAW
ncbi:gamma-glutamyltransferase family protein [Alicyclobacillus dauci]|uniref:Gamma-glutamyltransferase family protein n=1 Tax=Alicyclobacillus dauci TaxID=1475485 RepID=A0ABY6Z344_9BACL|nr:gamma-glutamyltransferase family protein [Alicyclobacillus dauci]WAH37261.1 gamma-glutamyltransferase family protein [Alicyclobacillus dauci]